MSIHIRFLCNHIYVIYVYTYSKCTLFVVVTVAGGWWYGGGGVVLGGPKQAIPLPDHVGHVMLTYHQGGRGRGRGRGGSLPTGRNIKINYTLYRKGNGIPYFPF